MRPSSQSLRELQLRKSWADNCTLGVWDCKRRKTLSLQNTSVSVPLWPLLSKITSTTSSILTRSFTTYAWPSGKFALVGGPWWCVGCMWYFTSVYKKSRFKKNCKQYFHLRGVDYLKKKVCSKLHPNRMEMNLVIFHSFPGVQELWWCTQLWVDFLFS